MISDNMRQSNGLSIIIPTINENKNLCKLLPYLKANASSNLEIIVVDASECSISINDLCAEHHVVHLHSHKCQRATQLDLGAQNATYDNLLFLHADVIPPTTYYQDILTLLDEKNCCGSFSYEFDSPSKLLAINASTTQSIGLFTGGGDQGLIMTKQDYLSIGGYDTNVNFMEDFDIYDRIKASDLTFKIVNNPALVSARKYLKNSYLRVNLIHFLVFGGYKLGVDGDRLARLYRALIRS